MRCLSGRTPTAGNFASQLNVRRLIMQERRELSHADLKLLATAVTEVWPELQETRTTEDLISGWRGLLTKYKLEITEKQQNRRIRE